MFMGNESPTLSLPQRKGEGDHLWKLSIVLIFFASFVFAQADEDSRSRNQPREPFRIIGNIYYVGASDIASYLITTPKGHFLIDGGFVETAPMILQHIQQLGFNPKDVKYLLNSQAHFDHAGGLAELKRATGAQMIASKEDGAVIERGGKNDFYFGDKYTFPPVPVDHILKDRGPLKLGGTSLTPVLTPGHTKGCTTWVTSVNESGEKHDVVFLCGLSILPETKLKGNEAYPSIATDYQHSYATLKSLPCDVLLGAHGSYYNLEDKAAALKDNPATNPFVVPGELRKLVEEKEKEFQDLTQGQASESKNK